MKKRKPRLEIGRLIVFEVDNNTKYGIIQENLLSQASKEETVEYIFYGRMETRRRISI